VRILHTVHAYPPQVGGTERVVHRLSRGLAERGHDVEVATAAHPERGETVDGIRVQGFAETPRGAWAYRRWVLDGLAEDRWDVVMTYHSKVWSHLALWPFPERLANRWVYMPVEFTDLDSRRPRHLVYYRTVEPASLRKAARAVTLTKADEARARELAPEAELATIPNGVDHAWWAAGEAGDVRERYGLPDEAPLVTYVGGFWVHKRVPDLVDAIARTDDLHLVLAGDPRGRGQAVRERSREAGVADRVHLPGRVPREDVRRLYHASAVHASASDNEGFGLTYLEAMACGLPVVARETGIVPELVDQGAAVEIAGDPAGFARSIERLAGKGEANVEVAERYDWDNIVGRVEACYEEVAR
jgi:glycosyltransferase involved in cell wall biosynthesis